MAVIRIRKNDLFRQGLVIVDGALYEIIVKSAKEKMKKWLPKITKKFFLPLISSYVFLKDDNKIIPVINGRFVKLHLFIWDIQINEPQSATVFLRLSLPIIATETAHQKIWELLLEKIGLPETTLTNGDLCLNVVLKDANCPIEVKSSRYPNGQRTFIARNNKNK
ncbi:MAG: hypothetical protein AAB432_01540 [Patescibacteria group bacterium]|mgnify:FL=1